MLAEDSIYVRVKGDATAYLRGPSKIASPFAGGELGFWQGATKEQSQSSVSEEQRSQKPNSPQPGGAGRRPAVCGVTRRLNPHEGIRLPRALYPTRRRSRPMVNLLLSGPLAFLFSSLFSNLCINDVLTGQFILMEFIAETGLDGLCIQKIQDCPHLS